MWINILNFNCFFKFVNISFHFPITKCVHFSVNLMYFQYNLMVFYFYLSSQSFWMSITCPINKICQFFYFYTFSPCSTKSGSFKINLFSKLFFFQNYVTLNTSKINKNSLFANLKIVKNDCYEQKQLNTLVCDAFLYRKIRINTYNLLKVKSHFLTIFCWRQTSWMTAK